MSVVVSLRGMLRLIRIDTVDNVGFLAGRLITCQRTLQALMRLCGCTNFPERSLYADIV